MTALRDASELLWPALAETLTQLDLGSEHAAAVRAAKRYAQIIDGCADQEWAARWLMPLFLDALGELGATPAAVARLTKGGKPADATPGQLQKLRAARSGGR
jgi:hypothetical protein